MDATSGSKLIEDRPFTVGSTDELLSVTEDEGAGMVSLDLRCYTEQGSTESRQQIARSFVTIPASLMDELAATWQDKHRAGATRA